MSAKRPVPHREDGAPWRNLHGRRHGKALRPGQEALLETLLPRLAVPRVGWEENPERERIDPGALFEPRPRAVHLEIGFGGGEHMLATAEAHPELGLIGCETFVNGVAMCLSALSRRGIGNVRLHMGDARDLLDVLPDASIARAYVLYPDPWPKARHAKRRIVNPETLDPLARVLAPGAELRVATDIEIYVRHSLAAIRAHPAFEWTAEGPRDWREPWAGWPSTRYEAKALREGRTPHYLTFRRL
ncbi:MAG TPA: tRNA (guanosine(46)-N7)-methyltransferase TrmB [Paracoccaceae bacterium]|nr:tRNA (guanosine(46)-N7)-methyltransferase TrmB [Paracoccaceae bacterium]